jgi:hypothetical protein
MEKSKFISDDLLVFLLGFFSCLILFLSLSVLSIEKPLNLAGFSVNSNTNSNGNDSLDAPGNWIAKQDISVYEDKIVISLDNAGISSYAATGSMKPVLDVYSNGIRVVPDNEAEISVGDIVSFEYNSDLIVHRIVEKSSDDEGVYFITKGDSNNVSDGVKLRFSDIKYVTIGVLW